MVGEWPVLSLREAGVSLIDCEHRTPPASDSGYPYIAIPQIKHGRIDLAEVRRISREHFIEWTRKASPEPYDVILSRRCNPGETAFVPPGLECALGQNLVLLRADGTKVSQPFLRWLVRGPDWWEQVGKFINVGAVFDSLKCADIPNFRLPIPPLSVQRAIAHILGTLDDKIELNRQMNETLEAMARALFKSWFMDFDPVRAKAEGRDPGLPKDIADLFPDCFVDSDLGEIPAGWSVGSLENIASVTMGLSPDGASYNVDGLGTPLINGPVEFGDHFPVKTKWTTSPTRLAQVGDLILCVRGSTTGRRVVADDFYCLGRGVCAIRPNRGMRTFLYQALNASINSLLSKTTGSVFPNLSAPDIKNFPILVPPQEVAQAFDGATEPMTERAEANVRESRTLAAVRDTLLPKLISGELRIKDAGRLVDPVARQSLHL
jgi:type I restriction enzyme S subunit